MRSLVAWMLRVTGRFGERRDMDPFRSFTRDLKELHFLVRSIQRASFRIEIPDPLSDNIDRFLTVDLKTADLRFDSAVADVLKRILAKLRSYLESSHLADKERKLELIGDNIQRARLMRNLTQQDLARRIGRNESWVMLLELGLISTEELSCHGLACIWESLEVDKTVAHIQWDFLTSTD